MEVITTVVVLPELRYTPKYLQTGGITIYPVTNRRKRWLAADGLTHSSGIPALRRPAK
jgi:hypothetical protein